MSVNLQSSPVLHNHVCLLKTAMATVIHGNKANLLFNEGSQKSSVSKTLENTLELQPYHREDVTSFGASTESPQVNVAMVNLLTKSGDTVPLSVLVSQIATPLQNMTSM